MATLSSARLGLAVVFCGAGGLAAAAEPRAQLWAGLRALPRFPHPDRGKYSHLGQALSVTHGRHQKRIRLGASTLLLLPSGQKWSQCQTLSQWDRIWPLEGVQWMARVARAQFCLRQRQKWVTIHFKTWSVKGFCFLSL